ncbi:MAG: YpdA family putative bacillithiol disulfide reductase [Calditrichaeota bacterium]|nr:MAG: YpdA family putative bacillithiol disulfide reductase [Calditrichota bacterium]MBL1203838.1 YpdA family putative bacillithiol disulfide reductase [Calditrichota bacterium]NOG43670.1 YpdA family putative bacillithiol disulfide reductase [Calditrichota bacterium]
MKSNIYDVIIIGGGPIGIACAIEAKKNGLSNLVIEKGVLVNSVYHFPTNMTFFSTSQLLEIGDVPFIAHGDKPTRREALEYFRRVIQSWQINVNVYEEVKNIMKNENGLFSVSSSKESYLAKNIIVATGFYDTANLLNIPGENLPKVKHYYDEPHPYVGQKVVVIGAGNSAADVALETYLKGADVTLVMRESEFKPSVKYWILPNVNNRIKEGSINAYFESELTEIREKEVDIQTKEEKITIKNDFVLAMTGYRPDYPLLEKFGILIGDDEFLEPSHNPDTLETNIPNVYLAGVVLGGLRTGRWFIENAREHAEKIISNILK